MTRRIPLLAFGSGMALTSAQAFTCGNYSHGPALTDIERQASEGIPTDKSVQGRALDGWEGVWQSVNPYLLSGDLSPVLEQEAGKPGGKSVEEYRAYYEKSYATNVEQIGIENDVIEFHISETVNSCKYHYSNYKVLYYTSGKEGVRCLFEYQQGGANAPKFMQFSDHIIDPRKLQHFHVFTGNESQEALLKEMDSWPTYYPYTLHKEQIVNEMLHHQNR